MAVSGSNAPFINDALVAWPPPPSSARFAAASPPQQIARSSRSPYTTSPLTSPNPRSPTSASFIPISTKYSAPGIRRVGAPSASASGGLALSPKGKERATLSSSFDEEEQRREQRWQRRNYPPPRRPLSPTHLGRIAQSFGIVVPSSINSTPSKSQSGSPTPRATSSAAAAASQQMVAVVPPLLLLPPADGLDASAERERKRRFGRGRLLPLQPTLGAMLVAIAREFGLPSTTGIHVYLGAKGGAVRGDSVDSGSGDDDSTGSGPLITASSWTTLFAHAARTNVPSPSSTPASTPRKARPSTGAGAPSSLRGSLGVSPLAEVSASVARPLTNGSRRGVPGEDAEANNSRSSHGSSSASSFSPLTPSSQTAVPIMPSLPVFGSIEFDIEPTEAPWLDPWLRAGGPSRRKLDTGVRELTLVEKLKDARPQFVRQMEADEAERERKQAEAAAEAKRAADQKAEMEAKWALERELADQAEASRRAQAATRLADTREEQAARGLQHSFARIPEEESPVAGKYEQLAGDDDSEYGGSAFTDDDISFARDALNADMLASGFDDPLDDLSRLRQNRAAATSFPTIADIGTNRVLDPSLDPGDTEELDEPSEQLAEVVAMLGADGQDALASPITLPRRDRTPQGSPLSSLKQLQMDDDQRGSGMLMADQISNLEKMMRDLSPRDLQGLSPMRPQDPTLGPNGTTLDDLPPRGTSKLPYLQPEPTPSPLGMRSASEPQHGSKPSIGSAGSLSPPAAESGGLLPAMKMTHASPATGRRPVDTVTMRSVSAPKAAPPRPQRPPTPDLASPELPKHHLSRDLVDTIKSHPSPPTPVTRRNSTMFRGIARRVSTSIKPGTGAGTGAGVYASPEAPGGRPPSSYTPASTLSRRDVPDSNGEERTRSRFFNFPKRERGRDSVIEPRPTITHISAPFATSHNKHVNVGDMAGGGRPAPVSIRMSGEERRNSQLPASPDSPRNVRRKPVPGVAGNGTGAGSDRGSVGSVYSPTR